MRELAGDEGVDRLREAVGLPLSTYFSGPKITWMLDNVDGARERAEDGELAFGTMDTWVLWNLTGERGPRDRRDQRQPHDADGPRDARLARAEPRADGHPALDAAGDPLLQRALRRGVGHRDRRAPDRRHPRRPAGGAVRADVLRAAATRRTPTAPARSCSSTPARRSCAPDKLLTSVGYKLGDGPAELRARGLDRGHRRAHPVAARPAEDHRLGARGRGARAQRRRQRRRLLRAGVLRPVRARTGATTRAA